MLKKNNRSSKTLQVNLFLVNGQNDTRAITKAEILHIAKQHSESYYHSSLFKLYEESLDINSRRTEEAEYVDIIDDHKYSDCKSLEEGENKH